MLGPSYCVLRVRGIPIRLHWSMGLILFSMPWELGIATALFLAVGVMASIAFHELAHSLVAERKGCSVGEILLTPIGGIAQIVGMPARAMDELLIAAAGPAASLALAAALFFGGALIPFPGILPDGGRAGVNAVQFLGLVNLVLAIFNLLPSFPMDGGRILRAALSRRMGMVRATRIAMRIGRALAMLFGLWGFFDLMHGRGWAGLVRIAVAAAVYTFAGMEYRAVLARSRGRGRHFGGDFGPATGAEEGDRVLIGPPPYRDGRGSQSELKSLTGDDEWPRFGRN